MKHLTIMHKLVALIIIMAMVMAWLTHLMVGRLHDTAFATRHDMLRAQVDSSIAILQHYHDLENAGDLTRAEAQAKAFDAIGSIRFDPHGYMFVSKFSGVFVVRNHLGTRHARDRGGL